MFFAKKSFKIAFLDVLNTKETFYATKIGTFHKVKNRNFPKGLTHDFGQQKFQKICICFSSKYDQKRVSLCSTQNRNHFRPQKWDFFIRPKIAIFQRGNPRFWTKIFQNIFFAFSQNSLKNRVSSSSKQNRNIFRPQKWDFFITPKIAIFQKGNPRFWTKKFQNIFFLRFLKIPLKKEFLHVLNKKETFLDRKMGFFHKAKNRNFSKG